MIGQFVLYHNQFTRIVGEETIFGETCLGIFVKPAGPIHRGGLLRQSNEHLWEATAGQRLTDVRKEAILTGFEEAYRAKRYEDIITVGGKLNQSLVDSSTEIFDFIDIAGTKLG